MNLNPLNILFLISVLNVLTIYILALSIFLSTDSVPRIVQGIAVMICVQETYICLELILISMESNNKIRCSEVHTLIYHLPFILQFQPAEAVSIISALQMRTGSK